MSPRALLARIALALLLLFGQQASVLHALGHLAERPIPGDAPHAPDAPACDQCVAFSGLGGALPAAALPLAPAPAVIVCAAQAAAQFAAVPLRAYSPRAPPRLA